jgi:parallel beta-helix repeat protein
MKRFISILIFLLAGFASKSTNYYSAPAGNDATGDGSIGFPWFSMTKPYNLMNPGDTLFMRDGTYAYTDQDQCYLVGNSGTSGSYIVIMSYPGETATITKGTGYTNNDLHWRGGVFLSANYVKLYKLIFTGFEHGTDPVTGFIWRGLYMENANFCIIEQCISHDNEYGFNLQDNSKGNLFLNCDAYNNWDINTGGGNADGFGWGYLTVNDVDTPNVARGCRSWWNGDDGFDGWHGDEVGGIVVLDSCWSWYNGYYKNTFNDAGNGEGFKAGGGDGGSSGVMNRYYQNCIGFHNRNKGFEQNNLKGNVTLYNCVSILNNNHGINLNENSSAHVIKNCVSVYNNGTQLFLNSESIAVSSNNSTNDGSSSSTNDATYADFSDADTSMASAHAQLSATRKSNGSLPDITFLHLDSGSDLIDAGTDVGISYEGSAPDRGAFEYSTVSVANTYYIATDGDDANPGTFAEPWATVEHITGNVSAGDLVYIRGGTYTSAEPATSFQKFQIYNLTGTASSYITIKNYPGETPIFDCSTTLGTNSTVIGVYISNCDYVRIEGLEVKDLAQDPSPTNSVIGLQVDGCYGVQVVGCSVHDIEGYGVYNFNSDSTHWYRCDVYKCGDVYTGWGDANGFNCTGGDASTDVTVEECRFWWCSDDGFDLFGIDGTFYIINNWSFWNGFEPGTFTPAGDGYGYKLGPAATDQSASPIRRYVWGNMAFGNLTGGFTQNSGQMKYELYNNMSYYNGTYGFTWIWHTGITQISMNNAAYGNDYDQDGSPIVGTFNTWNGGVTFNNSDIFSRDSSLATGPRGKNFKLPDIPFLRLTWSSDLIDAGNDVGLPFRGQEPPWLRKPPIGY